MTGPPALRGGSWRYEDPDAFWCGVRAIAYPWVQNLTVGFRPARDAEEGGDGIQ